MVERVGIEIFVDPRPAEFGAKRGERAMTSLERSAQRTDKQFNSLDRTAKVLGTTIAGLFAVGAVAAGVRQAIKQYADFETALIGVAKTANLSDEQMLAFGETIENMSLKLPKTAVELLGIAEAAGQLGVTGSANLEKFAETIARLGASSDLQGGEAATVLARILTVTGDGVENIDQFASVIVALGNSFAASESEIAHMTSEVARSTSTFDVSSASAAAMGATLKSLGVRAELGGSTVGRAFRAIDTAIRGGGQSVENLSQLTGIAVEDLEKAFGDNSTAVFQKFVAGLGTAMNEGSSATEVLDRFGLKGEEILKTLPVLARNSELFGRAMATAAKEVKNNTALLAESEKAFGTTNADLIKAENSVISLAKAFGGKLAPSVSGAARSFTQFVGDADGAAEAANTLVTTGGALAIVMGAHLTQGLQASAVAEAKYAKEALAGNVVTLGGITAGEQKAAMSVQMVANELMKADAAIVSAQADLAGVKATQAVVVAERELEVVRLRAQISQKGRTDSINRLVEMRRAEVAIGTQVTVAETNLAIAKNGSSIASGRATVATTAYSVAQQQTLVTTRTLTAATSILKTGMAFLGGPLGVAALAGFGIYQFATSAQDAISPTDALEKSVKGLKNTFTELTVNQLNKRLADLNDQIKLSREEVEKLADVSKNGKRIASDTQYAMQLNLTQRESIDILDELDEKTKTLTTSEKLRDDILARREALTTSKPKDKKEGSIAVPIDPKLISSQERLLTSLQREAAIYGEITREATLRYDTEIGSLSALDAPRKSALIDAARQLDALEKQEIAEQKLADQIENNEKIYAQTNAELQKQIALFGETGRAAELRYNLEYGALATLDAPRKSALLDAAKQLDLIEKQKVSEQELADQRKKSQQEFDSLSQELVPQERILAAYANRRQLIMANTQEDGERRRELLLLLEEQTNNELLVLNGSFWDRYLFSAQENLRTLDDLSLSTIENLSTGIGSAFEKMIFESQSFGEAFSNLAEGMARSMVGALGKMAAEWLIYQAVQLLVGKSTATGSVTALTAQAEAMSIMAGLNAFSSTAAIPIVGPLAAPGAAAAAIAVTQPMAAAVAAISSAQLASFDGGGYTGDGSRQGGLDGKGGFLAVMHPQETVVDHTKNQSSKAGTKWSVIINNAAPGEHNVNIDEERMMLTVDLAVDRVVDELNGGRVADGIESRYGVNPAFGARR